MARVDVSSYAGESGDIVKSMILPEKYPTIRMKDGFANVKTAVATPFDEIPNNWSAPDANGTSWMGGFLFRGTLHNAMIFDSNPNTSSYTYLWSLSDGTSTISIPANSQRKFAPIYAAATTSYRPHGDTLWNETDANGDPYFWNDADSTPKGTISVVTVGAWTGSATLYKYDGAQGQEVSVQAIAGAGTVTFALGSISGAGAGWYRVELLNDSGTTGTFSISQTYNGNSVWRQLVLPGYENNVNNVSNIRVQGGTILWRNTTSDQYVNGRLTAVQFGKGQSISEVISGGLPGMFTFISQVREGVTRDFKKGFYAFLKPAEEGDLAYRRPLTANTSLLWSGGEPIARQSGFLAFVAQVVSSNSAPATNTQMRRFIPLEYQTNNLWAEVKNPSTPRDVWEQSCATIAVIPQFHENPSHIGEIIAEVAKGGAVAAENIGPWLQKNFDNETVQSVGRFLENVLAPGLRIGAPILKRLLAPDDASASQIAARRRRPNGY